MVITTSGSFELSDLDFRRLFIRTSRPPLLDHERSHQQLDCAIPTRCPPHARREAERLAVPTRTDVALEGGITSHVSIVTRELKIPAIVGTRTATDSIKTGDTIELNMVSGEIIINNK
jgi:hypothetical protein